MKGQGDRFWFFAGYHGLDSLCRDRRTASAQNFTIFCTQSASQRHLRDFQWHLYCRKRLGITASDHGQIKRWLRFARRYAALGILSPGPAVPARRSGVCPDAGSCKSLKPTLWHSATHFTTPRHRKSMREWNGSPRYCVKNAIRMPEHSLTAAKIQ